MNIEKMPVNLALEWLVIVSHGQFHGSPFGLLVVIKKEATAFQK